MNILILGGTRYFGKRLTQLLINEGYNITLATRGTTPNPFPGKVAHHTLDRSDARALASLAKQTHWDLVFDQVCYSPNDAARACEAFEGRVTRYIHTSTSSVYQTAGERPESDFDPFNYKIEMGERDAFSYGEAKRQAEAVYFQKANFEVAAMRIPIVLGPDDYTGRLEFHINHVRQAQPIVIPNLDAETSFISSAEAASFLLWLGKSKTTGPINACSNGRISIKEVLATIEQHLGKQAKTTTAGPEADHTPFTDEKSRWLDNRRAQEEGFHFESLRAWFPRLVEETCKKQLVYACSAAH